MKYFNWKKPLAFALAAILLITGIPVSAFAHQAEDNQPSLLEEISDNRISDISANTQDTTSSVPEVPLQSSISSASIAPLAEGKSVSDGNLDDDSIDIGTYKSKLPVVYITTEGGADIVSKEDYLNATMKIQGNDTYTDSSILYDGEIEIRGRGNSTWNMPKKPYKIKLDKKSDIFGMGKHKHWVLLANYSDASLMRNTLAYNLSGSLGMPQMETVWVDVVLNGKYVGNYQFCEQIKLDSNNRVSIFDWEGMAEDAAEVIAKAEGLSKELAGNLEDSMKEKDMSWITTGTVTFNDSTYNISDYPEIVVPDINGGYLLELDEYYDEVSVFKTKSGQPMMFKNPEFVTTNQDMMDYVQTYIQSFEDAVQAYDYSVRYNDTTTHYSQLFDFDSLVDYWLISEIFFNEELNKKSTYMYQDINGLFYMGPIWDMDYSSGGMGETTLTNQWATVYFNKNAQKDMWYKHLIKDPYFILKAQERYWKIRDDQVQDMLDSIQPAKNLLTESAVANAEVWYRNDTENSNFEQRVDDLQSWFKEHLNWLDEQMESEDTLLSSLGYPTSNISISLTDMNGNALPADTISTKNAAGALVEEGNDIQLTVNSDIYKYEACDIFINGKHLNILPAPGDTITISSELLTADTGEKNIIEAKLATNTGVSKNYFTIIESKSTDTPAIEFYESKLPVVYITTEGGAKITSKEDYVNATLKIQGNETYSDSSILYDGEIEIRGRGNSTWNMPKKPYKIKLGSKANLFGMGKHKHWVLLANYSDASLMRNTLAYNLSGSLGMPQMETVWVDVVLNGEYIGNYQFCEQIKLDKNNRVSIFDWEGLAEDAAEIIAEAEGLSKDLAGDLEDQMKEKDMSWITSDTVTFNGKTYKISDYPDIEVPAITGGYLLELDEYYDEVSVFKTKSGQPMMFKNPEFVTTNQDMMDYVQTYIQSFEDAVHSLDYSVSYNNATTHYSQLFDFNSLVDYWLISEIFFNEELNKKSTYMYKDIDGLFYMGPIWDMDYSSGGEGQTHHTNQWATTYFSLNAQKDMWYKYLIQDPYFLLKAQERYWEIRNVQVKAMIDSIEPSKTLLQESADANADIWYKSRNFGQEVDQLKSWFMEHLTWLDAQMENEDTLLSSLGYEASSFILTVTDSKGEALAKDTVSTIVPADAVAYEGENLQLTVSSNTLTEGSVDIFVNSKKVGTVGLEESFTINSKDLSSALGKKNVIEAKLIGEEKIAKGCITVIEVENPNPPTPGGDNNDQPSVPEIEGFKVEIEEDLVYTGKALKPQVMVYDGQTLLKKDKDYKLTYKNNINAGIAESAEFNSEKPYVIIEGKGNYHGTLNINFAIQKASISDNNGLEAAGVKLSYSDQLEVNSKKDVNPFKSIKLGKNLKKGTDFTLSLIAKETSLNAGTGEIPVEGGLIPKNATGIFELKITGTGNYDGEIIKTVTVFAKESLLKNAKIKLDSKFKSVDLQTFKTTYLHKLPLGAYQVTMGNEPLTEGTHYTATYKNTASIGTATLVIEGIAPYYGTKTVTFKLTGKKLSNSTLLVEGLTDKDYTGVPVTQEGIKVSYKDRNQAATELVEGTDYTIDYSNHLKKGKATITITALATSGYQGSVKKTFTIRPQELKEEMKAASMDNITVEYEKVGAKPYDKLILTNNEGQTLVYNQDYTVTYENNKKVGSGAMVVKGKGNYTGSLNVPFTIEKASLSSNKITITLKEAAFNQKKKDNYEYKPGIIIKDGNKTLSSKNDYEIIYENNTQEAYKKYYLSEGIDSQLTEADMPRIIIKGRGNYTTTEDLVLELPVYRTKLTSKNLYAVILDGNYTGTQSKPEVRLYYSSDNKLVKNAKSKGITSKEELLGMGFVKLESSQYSLSFGTNIFAGPNKGTVKVSGKATEYGGSVTFKFNIKSREIKTN